MQDLDRQVLAVLAKDVLQLFANYLAGTVMRIDDAVADFEVDLREFNEYCLVEFARFFIAFEVVQVGIQ